MLLTRLTALSALLVVGGCYRYTPSSPQEIAPGQVVRLRLSPEEAGKYADLRLANPRLLDGTVVDRNGSELMVDASLRVSEPGAGPRELMQRLNVPLTGVLDVELRELDRTRTSFLMAGGAAALGAVIAASLGGSGSEDGPGNENPEARRIPFFRLRLSF